MLRWLVAALLLANLLFYAWTQGWLDGVAGVRADGDREPERMSRQVRPESVRILPPQTASQPASGASAASAASETARSSAACLEAGPFAADEIRGVDAALQAALPAEWRGGWTTVKTERPGAWILYMGKFANREALLKKADELKRRKVAYDEVHAPPALDMGLSIGRYDDKGAAERALVKFGEQGIHTARVAELNPPVAAYMLRAANADGPFAARLASLRIVALGKGFAECAARAAAT